MVVVLPLLSNDCRNGGNGSRVRAAQGGELMLQVAEHDTLNRDGGSHDGIRPEHASNDAEHEPAKAAEPVAAAPLPPAALQLSAKYGPVPLLVCAEPRQLIDHMSCGEPSHENLAGIDANGAMLAGMIDLDDAITEAFSNSWQELFHEAWHRS